MEAWKKRLVKSIANLGDGNCLTERPKVFCWLLGRYFPRLVVPVGSPFPHLWPSTETPKPTSTILQDYWSQNGCRIHGLQRLFMVQWPDPRWEHAFPFFWKCK